MRDIAFQGKRTFKEFLESNERIATNVLSERLSRPEAQGILSRHQSKHNRVANVYRLTRKGLDLLPILMEVVLWSDTYLEIADEGRALAEAIRHDREGLLARLNEDNSGDWVE